MEWLWNLRNERTEWNKKHAELGLSGPRGGVGVLSGMGHRRGCGRFLHGA